jgi:hypothetical protein
MILPWYKSKQFWFNILAVVVTIATAFGFDSFAPDPRYLLIAQLAIAVINVVLRFAFGSPSFTAKDSFVKGYAGRPDYTAANRRAALWTASATSAALIVAAALAW